VVAVEADVEAELALPAAAPAEVAAAEALLAAAVAEVLFETVTHADPFQTNISPAEVLKYIAPDARALPSLSNVGADDLGPR
jgi:hypothetical protein